MKEKQQIKKIRPITAIKSLEAYNVKVLALIQQCEMALQHKLVDPVIADTMQNALNEVKEFNNQE